MINHHHSASHPHQQQLQQQRPSMGSMEFSMLPDEILVTIGTSVARVCGIQDFVYLSMASKRLKKLLVDSEATVSEVIRIRSSRIDATASAMLLPSSSPSSSWPIGIHTLEQLRFYESVVGQHHHNLLEENRVHFEFAELEIDSSSIDLIETVQRLLQKHPSASVVLDAHCGTPAPSEIAWLYSHYRGNVVYEAIVAAVNPCITTTMSFDVTATTTATAASSTTTTATTAKMVPDLHDRIRVRAWGKTVSEQASRSQHPFGERARDGRGWVEVFLRMEGNNDSNNGGPQDRVLELPPRPGFYQTVTATPLELSSAGDRSAAEIATHLLHDSFR